MILQPILSTAIEVTLWMAMLTGMGVETLGGFGREYYLGYTLWATFVGRITTNWMYEFMMLEQIETGRVNSILVRPISFYEFYLSQFVGYKLLAAFFSLALPLLACFYFKAPMQVERLPAMILLVTYYLVLAHTLSFCVACLAFFMNRATSFTGLKNMLMWVLAGELVPLDLYPEPLRTLLLHSPFAAGVYVPVSYITGRIGHGALLQSFVSVTLGIVVFAVIGAVLWRRGLRSYTGTGA